MENVINIMRHEAVFNPKDHPYTVHIIGAGATGSHVFAALVNLGVTNISVYDYDDVEEHNLANQIYTGSDVGKPKVEGCREYVKHKLGLEEAPDDMRFINDKVTPITLATRDYCKGGIVFLLTDTMDSRRSIFSQLTRHHDEANADGAVMRTLAALIIETRMASTHGAVSLSTHLTGTPARSGCVHWSMTTTKTPLNYHHAAQRSASALPHR
jgi:hypothetical protein